MVDSHFHSSALRSRGVDPDALLRDLTDHGMGALVDVAIQPEEMEDTASRNTSYSELYRTCGLHPSLAGRTDWREALSKVDSLLASGRFSAVGETGLDWFRLYAPSERQLEIFEAQLSLARRWDRPVIVHNREADRDCLQMIQRASLPRGGIMHCFSSGPEWISPFLDEGMYISFAGNLTYRSAHALRDALRLVPGNRLLFETDSPFLAPHPYRGKTNHPGMVAYVYAIAAETRGCAVEELIRITAENLRSLLNTSRVAE